MKKLLIYSTILAPLGMMLFLFLSFQQIKEVDAVIDHADKTVQILTFAHDMPKDTAQHMAAEYFAERIKQLSGGTLRIVIHPNQTLGTDQQMVASAIKGDIDFVLPPTSKLVAITPEMSILDLPFLFDSVDAAYQVLDGALGAALIERVRANGLSCFNYWDSGFKQITSNFPVANADDFIGKPFRIMKSPILEKQYSLLGANPIPIDFSKVLDALKDGVIDGQENSISSIYSKKFYTAQKYLTITNHGYLAQLFCISEKSKSRLSDEQLEIISNAASEAKVFQRKTSSLMQTRYLGEIKKSSMKVSMFSMRQKEDFKQRLKSLREVAEKDWPDLCRVLEMELAFIDANQNDYYVVGLDADMSAGSAASGIAIQRGLEIAIDKINQAGGVLEKPIRLVVRDHAGNVERGLENIRHFSSLPNVLAVFGGLHSPVILSELPLLHEHKLPMMVPWAAATSITDNKHENNYVFRVSLRDADVGPFLINGALAKTHKIALLLENTGWGRSNQKTMSDFLSGVELKPTETVFFNWGERYFDDILDRITESGAELIVFVGNAPEGAELMKAISNRDKKIPVVSHWGITGGDFFKHTKEYLNEIDLVFVQSYSFLNANDTNPVKNQFIEHYKERFGVETAEQIFAPTGSAQAYDLMNMLALAVTMGGSDKRGDIVKSMESISEMQGLVKFYKKPFSHDDRDALDPEDYIFARFSDDGVIRPMRPIK